MTLLLDLAMVEYPEFYRNPAYAQRREERCSEICLLWVEKNSNTVVFTVPMVIGLLLRQMRVSGRYSLPWSLVLWGRES